MTMKRFILVTLAFASVALGAEFLRGTLSGTGTQTLNVGPGSSRLALQCTTDVRYKLSRADAADAGNLVTANDALIATGDPYIIDKTNAYSLLNVAHSDIAADGGGGSAISCSVFVRNP
jgi:hypothetical protein